jgi:hypothetical protein
VRRSNCFFWALVAWWRWRRQGAYFALRLSRHIWGWHWLVYHPRFKRWVHYEPRWVDGCPKVIWVKLLYPGIVKRDD